MSITHDAFDLTVQAPYPPTHRQQTWDLHPSTGMFSSDIMRMNETTISPKIIRAVVQNL